MYKINLYIKKKNKTDSHFTQTYVGVFEQYRKNKYLDLKIVFTSPSKSKIKKNQTNFRRGGGFCLFVGQMIYKKETQTERFISFSWFKLRNMCMMDGKDGMGCDGWWATI